MFNSKQKTTIKRIGAFACAGILAATTMFGATGCIFGGEENNDVNSVSQDTYTIKLGAKNDMVNDALTFYVTDVQRRASSVFAGATILASGNSNIPGMDGTTEQTIGNAAKDNNIAIQVDVKFQWNVNKYVTSVMNAGATSSPNPPSSLGDLLIPGTYMYVTGVDSNGDDYTSADFLVPVAQDNINALAINAQWNYDILNAPLPQAGDEVEGSILIYVPSSIDDLKLRIITPVDGVDITSGNADLSQSACKIFELPLSYKAE